MIKRDTSYEPKQGQFYITDLSDDQILWNHYPGLSTKNEPYVNCDQSVVWFSYQRHGINLIGLFNLND